MIRKSSSSGFSCERKSVALVVFVVILVDDVVNLPMPLLLSLTICSPLFLPHIGQKVICKILYFLSVLFWWFCFFFFLFFTQCCFFLCEPRGAVENVKNVCDNCGPAPSSAPRHTRPLPAATPTSLPAAWTTNKVKNKWKLFRFISFVIWI